jgi:DNA-binding Xre family transcriptional regulator
MVSRKTGISQSRMSQLSTNETTKLRADELYVIALALELDPCEVLKELYGDVGVDFLLHES